MEIEVFDEESKESEYGILENIKNMILDIFLSIKEGLMSCQEEEDEEWEQNRRKMGK